MEKPDRFWDRAARLYDKRVQKDEDYTRAVARFAKYLKADDSVLDFACGTGVITFKIAAEVGEVYGIDTSERMIELGKQRARDRDVANVQFAQKMIFNEGLQRESYDVILVFNVLHLVEDPRKVVQRASELLRPGGIMVSETPCLGEAGAFLKTLLLVLSKALFLSYLRMLKVSEVKDLMTDSGCQILESETLKSTVFVVARKQ